MDGFHGDPTHDLYETVLYKQISDLLITRREHYAVRDAIVIANIDLPWTGRRSWRTTPSSPACLAQLRPPGGNSGEVLMSSSYP